MTVFKEFKQFLLRGNVVDLAVGVLVGAAFGSVVTALVKDIITPLIAALVQAPNFSNLSFTLNGSQFMYGDFVNALVSFLFVAATIFFFVIKPMNVLVARSHKEPPADPTSKKCPECLSEIAMDAKRCAFCTQPQG
jgi:large conductance mechanosensitive channel